MFDSDKYRKSRIIEVRAWTSKRFEIIDSIPDNYLKGVCYFSLLESFVQEYEGHDKNSCSEAFCSFILKFQHSYDFLNETDPVTLYYDFQPQLQDSFDLSFLEFGSNYNPNHAIQTRLADEMIRVLRQLGVKDKKIYLHKYVRLLYSLRSKLSHELSSYTAMYSTELHLLENYPYYLQLSRSYVKDEVLVRDSVWELIVPVGFIRMLVVECIENFLKYCEDNSRDPFESNGAIRKSDTAWYD